MLVHCAAQPELKKDEGPVGLTLCPTRPLVKLSCCCRNQQTDWETCEKIPEAFASCTWKGMCSIRFNVDIYMFLYYPWCFTKESWRYKSKRKFTSSTSPWVWEVLPLQEVFPNTSSSVRSKAGRWLGTWPKIPEKVEVGKYPIIYSE